MRLHGPATLLVAALAAALVSVTLTAPPGTARAAAGIARELPGTGAVHAVTGVLLGFRAYDTLLEVFVLLLAVLGADIARAAPGRQLPRSAAADPPGPVLRALVNLVLPMIVLVAGYLLWVGTHAPGGAFQAAAVLGAGGVLLRLAAMAPALDPGRPWVRAALAAGPGFFLAVFAWGTLPGLLLAVESALAASIALALFCLFAAPQR